MRALSRYAWSGSQLVGSLVAALVALRSCRFGGPRELAVETNRPVETVSAAQLMPTAVAAVAEPSISTKHGRDRA
jgi:hypothetical protein